MQFVNKRYITNRYLEKYIKKEKAKTSVLLENNQPVLAKRKKITTELPKLIRYV